jgi:rhamnosyltransferase
LPRLAEQRVDGGFEIVAIDSGSRDATRELLAAAGARVLGIEQREFGHGRTRNRAAREAQGELFVFLSQDALPDDEKFLAELARSLDDPRTAGAFARVLPNEDDDPLTARTVLDAAEASTEAFVHELGAGELASGRDLARRVRFNNVASCIRAAALREIPFPDVEFGEDSAWAELALRAGWRIRFAPLAIVRHAHRYSMRSAFARYKIDAEFQRRVHGVRVRPSLVSVLRGIAYEVRADLRHVRATRASLAHLVRSPFLRGAQVLGQWRGSRG